MKLLGFKSYDWEPDGFTCGLPEDWMPHPTVTATVLRRPGTFPTFGMAVIGELFIPGKFGYTPNGTMTFEEAFTYLFKRLNPYDTSPGQLRGQRNDGTLISITAVTEVPARSSTQDRNFKDVNFVCANSSWVAISATTASGTFS